MDISREKKRSFLSNQSPEDQIAQPFEQAFNPPKESHKSTSHRLTHTETHTHTDIVSQGSFVSALWVFWSP